MGSRFGRMAEIMTKRKPTVVVIAGTTAVGKTDLSLELARRLDGEVVSVDSVQVYRQMNVGSAKIDVASCPDVPHHLLDVVDVSQSFSALDYYNLAVPVIQVSY
jgi:tRNA dimethylallyltransferase